MFSGLYDDCHVNCFSVGAFIYRAGVTGGSEVIAVSVSCDSQASPVFALFLQGEFLVGRLGDLQVFAGPGVSSVDGK